MKLICIIPLVSFWLFIIFQNASVNIANTPTDTLKQARQTAMLDFSKTKLFKMDSVFDVTSYDTLYRIAEQPIGPGKFKGVIVKTYADIIAVNIIATPFRWLLDTMERIDIQNKRIPSRAFEKDGRLFLWWDKRFPLTDSTLNILNKFHLIERGSKSDYSRFLGLGFNDSKRGADYYFCRSNLSVYKRVVTNKGTGYYDPPEIDCY
jgi:hypothetical protein